MAVTPTTTTTAKPAPGTQASAQAWINDPRSGQGGLSNYVAGQQEKMNAAVANNDQDMLNRLQADMSRVGYTLNNPSTTSSTPSTASTSTPGSDYIQNLRNLAAQGAQAQAYDSRNQADAVNIQNANAMQEIMANRGLGASGENVTAMLNQAANRSNSLNSINNQLASDLRGIDSDYNSNMLQNLYRNQDVDYRNSTFDWQKAMDMANLTGSYNGDRTLAGQQFDWGKSMDAAGLTGTLNGLRTLAGQAQDLNNTQVMAGLTGTLPNGQKTTTQQQQELQNLWTVADATGTIPNSLADMYGIPRGTQTQAAKQFAQDLAISQQNANTSRYSAETSRMQENRLNTPTPASSSSSSSSTSNKLSSKDSANNSAAIRNEIESETLSKADALKLLQANSDLVSDSDYNKLMTYINNMQ